MLCPLTELDSQIGRAIGCDHPGHADVVIRAHDVGSVERIAHEPRVHRRIVDAASLEPDALTGPRAKVTGEVEATAVGMRDVALCRHAYCLPGRDVCQARAPLQRR